MKMTRETKIGLTVAASSVFLIGALVAAQLRKSNDPEEEEAIPITSVTGNTQNPPPVPSPDVPSSTAKTSQGDGNHNLKRLVNESETMRNLQGEFRRFWKNDQPTRIMTALPVPGGLSPRAESPKAEIPAPKVVTPLGSTTNPWDVSMATPVDGNAIGVTFSTRSGALLPSER